MGDSLFRQTKILNEDKQIFGELDNFLSKYNEFQKKAIISNNNRILCVAGAGSGKTTVLTKKIEFLIKYKDVDPSKILAITFTRKAKQEMKERLLKNNLSPIVETFNSFCEKILRKNQLSIYGRQVRVMDRLAKMMAFSFALQNLNLKTEELVDKYFKENQKRNKSNDELINLLINDCFYILDYFKQKNQELYDFSEDLDDKKTAKLIYNICKQLTLYIKMNGFRTFNDQLIDVLTYFKKTSNIPKFDYILVDEYQDINDSQKEFLDILNPRNLFVVGDPRQSIFGWRGSNVNILLDFEKENPSCETIILDKNYRSNKNIVSFMNNFIEDLSMPDLKSNNNNEGKINLRNFNSEKEEFDYVIEKILELKKKDVFILTRTNKQLLQLSNLMKQKNIPHFIKTENNLSSNEITLSTIHSIKGLESDTVFILGCNDQNFPCKYSDHPLIDLLKTEYDKEKEEKRLLYVAISRAKNSLHLTYSGRRHTYFLTDKTKEIINVEISDKKLFNDNEDPLEKDFRKLEEQPASEKGSWEDLI